MPFCAKCGEIVSTDPAARCGACGATGFAQTAAGLDSSTFDQPDSKQTYMNAYLSRSMAEGVGGAAGATAIDSALKQALYDQVGTPGNVASGKPAAAPAGNKCPVCEKVVIGRGIAFSMGFFHPSCFLCLYCSRSLASNDVLVEHDGRPVCGKCAAPGRTAAASGPTVATPGPNAARIAQALGAAQKVVAAANMPAEEKSDEKCYDCGDPFEPLDGRVILEKLNRQYHPRCFRCESCHKVIQGTTFSNVAGRLVHTSCAASVQAAVAEASADASDICPECNRAVILGKYVELDGRKLHSACFLCAGCRKQLAGAAFRRVSSRPYCVPCAGAAR